MLIILGLVEQRNDVRLAVRDVFASFPRGLTSACNIITIIIVFINNSNVAEYDFRTSVFRHRKIDARGAWND